MGLYKTLLMFLLIADFSRAHGHVILEGRNIELHNKVLFLKNGNFLERYTCPKESISPINTKDCLIKVLDSFFWPRRIEIDLLKLYIFNRIAGKLSDIEKTNYQLFKNLTLIDDKIEELFNSETPSQERLELSELFEKRKTLNTTYNELLVSKSKAEDELHLIELKLKSSRSQDDAAKAEKLTQELAAAGLKLSSITQEIELIQNQILNFKISENKVLKLKALREQRKTIADQYKTNLDSVDEINKRVTGIKTFFSNFIEDESFTYEFSNDQLGTEQFPFEEAKSLIADYAEAYKHSDIMIDESIWRNGYFSLRTINKRSESTNEDRRKYFRWFRCSFIGVSLRGRVDDCKISIIMGEIDNPNAKPQEFNTCELDSTKVLSEPDQYDSETVEFVKKLTVSPNANLSRFNAAASSPSEGFDAHFIGICEGAYGFGE